MVLTLVFAALAVALAVIGVYGLLAWSVACRVGEIGVRIALGARTADILRMITKQGARMIVAGLALGTAGAFVLGRVLAARIPEIGNADTRCGVSRRIRRPRPLGALFAETPPRPVLSGFPQQSFPEMNIHGRSWAYLLRSGDLVPRKGVFESALQASYAPHRPASA